MSNYQSTLDQIGVAADAEVSALQAQLAAAQVPVVTSPSGLPMPAVEPAGWTRVRGVTNWTGAEFGSYPEPWFDTSNAGLYCGDKLTIATDSLLITRLATVGGQPRVTAITPGSGLPAQTFGRYSARARMWANGPGYKTAWLLWPDDNKWPSHGEVDFPEGPIGAGQDSAFLHYASATGGQVGFKMPAHLDSDWHTYTVEWSPDRVVFYLDDVVVGTATSQIPQTPMHWVLQNECDTTPRSGIKPPASTVATVEWDWYTIATKG